MNLFKYILKSNKYYKIHQFWFNYKINLYKINFKYVIFLIIILSNNPSTSGVEPQEKPFKIIVD